MPVFNNMLAGASGGAGGAAAGYEIERSLRFNYDDGSHLVRNFPLGNQRLFTFSAWLKLSVNEDTADNHYIFATDYNTSGSNAVIDRGFEFAYSKFSNKFEVSDYGASTGPGNNSGTSAWGMGVTTAVFRDPSAWYHVVLSIDTTQSTAANRVKLYVNNQLHALSSYPAQNAYLSINQARNHYIGAHYLNGTFTRFFDGYMADIHFIDGQALTADDFGAPDNNGVWQPKEASFTSPNNGTTWSSSGSSSASLENGNWGQVFDGTRYMYGGSGPSNGPAISNGSLTFSPSGLSGRVITAGVRGGGNKTYTVNGSAMTFGSGNAEVATIDLGSTQSITSVVGTSTAAGTWAQFYWIAVDGVLLVDGAGTYGTNGFHLDFADNSSKAALGTDTSGNSNTWDVNNLTASDAALTHWRQADSSDNPSNSSGTVTYRTQRAFTNPQTVTLVMDHQNTNVIGLQNITGITSLRFRINSRGNPKFGVNTGAMVSVGSLGGDYFNNNDANAAWYTWSNPPSTLNSIAAYGGGSGTGNFCAVWAIEVNGVRVVDLDPSGCDSLRDSPSQIDGQTDTGAGGEVVGNYATLNPLCKGSSATLTDGNLSATKAGSGYHSVISTIATPDSSGKWYYEVGSNVSGNNLVIGVIRTDFNQGYTLIRYLDADPLGYIYRASDGYKSNNNSDSSYGDSFTSGDIIGVALDLDAGTLTFYKNGVSQGIAFSGLSGKYYFGFSISGGYVATANFGQRAFAHPVSGYKSLNTASLHEPTIADGSQYFDAKIWNGDGASSRTISTSFEPDLVWVKSRSQSGRSHYLYDSARGFGANKELVSNSGVQEGSSNHLTQNHGYVSGTTATGFTLAAGASNSTYTNDSGNSYVGWVWDAGTGTTVTNNIGTIDSEVCASAASGFSIVTWTGNGQNNASVGHSLNAAPGIVIIKNRDLTTSYHTYVRALDSTGRYQVYLDGNQASTDFGTPFFNADSTKINLIGGSSAGINASGDFVAWCFAPVESYQVMGSYIGNGNALGPFVYTGMRPRLILIKRVSGGTANWCLYDSSRDTYNDATHVLCPDSNAAGNPNDAFVSDVSVDFLSNGFRIVDVDGEINNTSNNYIYLAIAEHPFKTARAR